MVIDIVVLSGGLGTRIRPVFTGPKGLVPIRDRPVVAHVIDWCLDFEPNHIVIAAGYRGQELRNFLHDQYLGRVDIEIEETPLGTAGCIPPLLPQLADPFVVVNGDTLVDGDLRGLWTHHVKAGSAATIGIVKTDRSDVGRVALQHPPPGSVTQFAEKGTALYPWTSAGVYVFQHSCFKRTLSLPASLETDILPRLASSGQLQAFPLNRVYDIGTPERLKEVEENWWTRCREESP